ncbi:hypothetical protein NQZ68_014445 [Dissostichus eleginoides]|nr:hypothetical protein NQZ68_014445 [Dissostichus eleginoides]
MPCGLANVKQQHRDPKQRTHFGGHVQINKKSCIICIDRIVHLQIRRCLPPQLTLRQPSLYLQVLMFTQGGTGQVTTGLWMITLEGRVISEGITPTFLTGLAAVFAIYYIFNLQYQEEAACTVEFIQSGADSHIKPPIILNRGVICELAPALHWYQPRERNKGHPGQVVSKKTAVIVQKNPATVNTHVSTLLKNLLDFEWDFIYCSGNTGKERNKDQQGVGHLYLNQKIPLCIRTVHTHPESS